ncbi:hypothetical protein U1872_07990 [Sphingomonas sp. RB3P16]|uniref:hypothetical protein n=1 Tax=Parasphingomonas frigoris TaxID=3096163 RepID=UPI002FC9709F
MASNTIPAPVCLANRLRRLLGAIEPWYNWGEVHVERMQEVRFGDGSHIEAGGEGPVRYVELQWLGIHLAVQFGRTPKAVRS